MLAAGLLAGIGTPGAATAGPAVVRVGPAASVESRPLDIRVQGLAPHARVTVVDAGHPVGGLLPYEPGSWVYDANVPCDERARESLRPHVLAFLRGLPAS